MKVAWATRCGLGTSKNVPEEGGSHNTLTIREEMTVSRSPKYRRCRMPREAFQVARTLEGGESSVLQLQSFLDLAGTPQGALTSRWPDCRQAVQASGSRM